MTSKNFKKPIWLNIFVISMITICLTIGTFTAYALSKDSSDITNNFIKDAIAIERVTPFTQGNETIYIEDSNVKLIESHSALHNRENADITLMTNGELEAGTSYSYKKQYLAKGKKISIDAIWTPTESNIRLGIKSSTGTITATTLTSGQGGVTYEILVSGDYYIYIGNPSKSSVNFGVSYIVE